MVEEKEAGNQEYLMDQGRLMDESETRGTLSLFGLVEEAKTCNFGGFGSNKNIWRRGKERAGMV